MSGWKDRIGDLKIKLLLVALLIILHTWPANVLASANDVCIDTGDIPKGVVDIAYQSDKPQKIKVIIQKDSQKYTYDLRADGSQQSFPLQMGNGDYQVSVLQNTQGTEYRCLKTEKVSLALADESTVYLNSIQNVDSVSSLVATEAERLTSGMADDEAKVEAIYNYIVSNCSYDYNKKNTVQTGYIPDPEDTLLTQKGICYDYASLFAAMTRGVGIPCKLVKGYADDIVGYHAWNEVSVDGKWVVVDAASDIQRRAAHTPYTMEKPAASYTKTSEF